MPSSLGFVWQQQGAAQGRQCAACTQACAGHRHIPEPTAHRVLQATRLSRCSLAPGMVQSSCVPCAHCSARHGGALHTPFQSLVKPYKRLLKPRGTPDDTHRGVIHDGGLHVHSPVSIPRPPLVRRPLQKAACTKDEGRVWERANRGGGGGRCGAQRPRARRRSTRERHAHAARLRTTAPRVPAPGRPNLTAYRARRGCQPVAAILTCHSSQRAFTSAVDWMQSHCWRTQPSGSHAACDASTTAAAGHDLDKPFVLSRYVPPASLPISAGPLGPAYASSTAARPTRCRSLRQHTPTPTPPHPPPTHPHTRTRLE